MSRRAGILLLVLSFCGLEASAQWSVDSAKRAIISQLHTKFVEDLLLIDGVMTRDNEGKDRLETLTPSNVFDIIIIDQELRSKMNFNPGKDILVVTTMDAAKTHYQK